MDIKNKDLVKRLLVALDYITTVKRDINNVIDGQCTNENKQKLGNHFTSLLQSSVNSKQRMFDFLDNEAKIIEDMLKDL